MGKINKLGCDSTMHLVHPYYLRCACVPTCSELNIVNNHANTVVLLLTVRIPKVHVSPSNGRRTIDATNKALI